MSGPSKFHVVDGTPPPDTSEERLRARLRKHPKPAEMLQCRRCSSNAVLQIKLGVMILNGKPTRGTPQWICAGECLRRGEHVVLF